MINMAQLHKAGLFPIMQDVHWVKSALLQHFGGAQQLRHTAENKRRPPGQRESDQSLHGFGLKSVAKTLKKYHGDFAWDYDAEGRLFTITAMMENR